MYRVVERRGRWLGVLSPHRANGRIGWIAAEHALLEGDALAARRSTARRAG